MRENVCVSAMRMFLWAQCSSTSQTMRVRVQTIMASAICMKDGGDGGGRENEGRQKRQMKRETLEGKTEERNRLIKKEKRTGEGVRQRDRRTGSESLSVEGGDPINQEARRSNYVPACGEQAYGCMCEFVIN